MEIGKLTFRPLNESINLVAKPIKDISAQTQLSDRIFVAEIDPDLADTTAFCNAYGVDRSISTNCLIVEAKRSDQTWYAACLVLADDTADINGLVRRYLGARKTSFAPMDTALQYTQMEYGGITPVGLPTDWPILIDESILDHEVVVVGGGVRGSKIALKTEIFRTLPNTVVMKIVKTA